jgi:hypothetical protein
MSLVRLVHPQCSHQVSVVSLIKKCDLFKNNTSLTIALYRVQSRVSLKDFRDFVCALEDKPISINDRNFPGLSQLSEEFRFRSLSKKLSAHRKLLRLSAAQTAERLSRISVLEERTVEGIPPDEFTFTINDKVSPTSTIEGVFRSPAVGEQHQGALVQEDLTFGLQESTQLTLLLFKVSFQGRKLFFKSHIRNHSFSSASNF